MTDTAAPAAAPAADPADESDEVQEHDRVTATGSGRAMLGDMRWRAPLIAIFRREFAGYFATPAAYVFIAVFLFATGGFTFFFGQFFAIGRADLAPFFGFHHWLHLIFMPAIAMRLWSEEYRQGSIELLLTLPAPLWTAVVGKFLAAWAVAGVALALTAPMWWTVNFLGDPDNGAIAAAYFGSFLMAGGYLAIGSAASALTGNQVIAFVTAVFLGFLVTAAGLPLVGEALDGVGLGGLADGAAALSSLERFRSLERGVVRLDDVVYFISLIGLWLVATGLAASRRRGG